jgi:hypothetical protein
MTIRPRAIPVSYLWARAAFIRPAASDPGSWKAVQARCVWNDPAGGDDWERSPPIEPVDADQSA